jgi:hypothetical protein
VNADDGGPREDRRHLQQATPSGLTGEGRPANNPTTPACQRTDPLDRPITPQDLLVLAAIAEVLDDPELAARWRWQALRVLELPARRAALHGELRAHPRFTSATIAEYSGQLGSLDAVDDLAGLGLGPGRPPAPPPPSTDGGDQPALFQPPPDPRRWAR